MKDSVNYEEFVVELLKELELQLADEQIVLKRERVLRANMELDCVYAHIPDRNAMPGFSLNQVFATYNTGVPIPLIAKEVVEEIEKVKSFPAEPIDISVEYIRENLYCAAVNASHNLELLKRVPHEIISDLAVVAKCHLETLTGEHCSLFIDYDKCSLLEMTPEEVLARAKENTAKKGVIVKPLVSEDDLPPEVIEALRKNPPWYLLENEDVFDGAGAIALPTVLEQAFHIIKKDWPDMESMFIVASSRHELLLVPCYAMCGVIDTLYALHEDAQRLLPVEDRLSDSIYHYDGQTQEITALSRYETPIVNE